jgi:hypothetical protein
MKTNRVIPVICVIACSWTQPVWSVEHELVLRATVTYAGTSAWSDEGQSYDEHVVVGASGTIRYLLETDNDGYLYARWPIGKYDVNVTGKGKHDFPPLGGASTWSFSKDDDKDYRMSINFFHKGGWAEFNTHSPPVKVSGVSIFGSAIDRGGWGYETMHLSWAFWDSTRHGKVTFEPGALKFTASGHGRNESRLKYEHLTSEGYMDATFSISVEAGEPRLRLTSVDTPGQSWGANSFIASDEITLEARLTPIREGVPVKWTVEGLEAAAGIKGFPKDVERKTDAAGYSTFSFTPSDNQALVKNRRTTWTNGNDKANSPIAFEVKAVIDSDPEVLEATLSKSGLGILWQDDIDRLRQEYFDFKARVIPERDDVVLSLGANYNRGNYAVQLSDQLEERFDNIVSAYRRQTITVAGQQMQMPASASIQVTTGGGFRNPRKNAIFSKFPATSYHTRGRALDLKPVETAVMVTVAGKTTRVVLDRHEVLFPALQKAASTQGRAIAEQGSQPVPVGCCPCTLKVRDPKTGEMVDKSFCEDHIHVQW